MRDTPGAERAVRWGSSVLQQLDHCSLPTLDAAGQQQRFAALERYLAEQVFALAAGTLPAGAGSS